ncbi:hypothetical protein M409DRAFT_63763 [Zasmidium cellare ATCC 36951]|uniref:Rad4 beta-hairpin domain-containing protein n=1 Tax=Zasmidium cellare ATCC 36951 TaxID=1080233 RepID=A0A6A6CZD7_ZASCE|nr:uncharacterized protein M409DRAFT_63763 [Zasmidium cellare ATCC 36951]KAF2171528.1 hypothetical protein M409DRAFT_63763 [Zasmidium cellare ATCC 36951]
MAPSRGKGKAAVKPTASSSRSSGRRTTRSRGTVHDDDVPDVYQSLLAEADDTGNDRDRDRPLKKRKVTPSKKSAVEKQAFSPAGIGPSKESEKPVPSERPSSPHEPPASSLQTVEDSSESDASEFEFEDVDLDGPGPDPADGIEDLAISVQPESSSKRPAQSRRKPASVAEKSQRLLVHKIHVLCMLTHCMHVNGRCNNPTAQKHLRKLLSPKTISYLKPKTSDSQFQRNRSFMEGLEQAVDTFNAEYRPGGAGLMRPHWSVEGEVERPFETKPVDRSDFITAAQTLEGSQDMGNQLFCALLRSAGVDARVVCSLQVLPFASVAKGSTPKKPVKEIIFAIASYDDPSKSRNTGDDTAVKASSTIGEVPAARRRLGQPSFASAEGSKPPTTPKKKTRPAPKLSYPVFWVEAFNEAQQKWIPVDPVTTHTINKAAKLEPPASYEYNQLLYAIAFEDDGSARDVTRRYAKAYNAKTRRHRVEASTDGAKWWKKTMRLCRRGYGKLDRDQVEDSELAQKEAREGMPANVLDFKDHPYYALERHTKRHEVIDPRREVGKVNAGTAAKPRMEAVFRRKDVLVCRSADKWYRIGREVKEGEQPLKHVPARRRRQQSVEDESEDAASTTGLYAPYQTQLYVPLPVQRGRIPKNVYGNLDVYAPSMVPAGGVHVRHPLAQRAAKLLRVDYADAVTGFKFQGRHGTAIVDGAVVAQQFEEAVRAAIEGFEQEQLEEESKARSLLALRVWKRFLTGLKIRERVEGYGDGSKKAAASEDEEMPDAAFYAGPLVEDERPLVTAGKFTIDELLAPTPKPAPEKRKRVVHDDDSDEDFAQVSDGEADFQPGGFFPSEGIRNTHMAGGFVPAGDDEPGGFVLDGNEDGGGFVPEDHGPGKKGGFIVDDGRDDGGGGFLLLPDAEDDDGAGGFLPEEGQDRQAGGFLPDEPAVDDTTKVASDYEGLIHTSNANDGHEDDDDDDDDLFSERPIPTGAEESAAPDGDAPGMNDASASSPKRTNDGIDVDMKDHGEEKKESMEEVEVDSDRASLPSHDSEDEDAEPDWLDSD